MVPDDTGSFRYYPIFLDIRGFRCIVIGGGSIAEQKVKQILRAGAKVRVVSPTLTETLQKWVREGEIQHEKRAYRKGDLRGARIVFAATNDPRANAKIWEEARAEGIWMNAVDDPLHCDFIVPSMVRRGNLTLAISTNGHSPALSRKIRQQLEGMFGEEYAIFLEILGAIRRQKLPQGADSKRRAECLRILVGSTILEAIRDRDKERVNEMLAQLYDKGVNLESLGVKFPRGDPERS